jgi:hypothetical protein
VRCIAILRSRVARPAPDEAVTTCEDAPIPGPGRPCGAPPAAQLPLQRVAVLPGSPEAARRKRAWVGFLILRVASSPVGRSCWYLSKHMSGASLFDSKAGAQDNSQGARIAPVPSDRSSIGRGLPMEDRAGSLLRRIAPCGTSRCSCVARLPLGGEASAAVQPRCGARRSARRMDAPHRRPCRPAWRVAATCIDHTPVGVWVLVAAPGAGRCGPRSRGWLMASDLSWRPCKRRPCACCPVRPHWPGQSLRISD